MIIQSILGHKVAAAALAVALGSTSAAAATGNLPMSQDAPLETTDLTSEEMVDDAKDLDDFESNDSGDVEAEVETDLDHLDDQVLPPANDEGVEYGDVACDDAKNHGEYVSGVAQDDSIEGNRGAIVSQAAKTDCGKSDKAESAAEKNERKEEKKAEKAERKAASADEDGEHDVDSEDDEPAATSQESRSRDDNGKGNGKKK